MYILIWAIKQARAGISMISREKTIAIVAVVLIVSLLPAYALFSSSHKLYKNETTPQLFCSKCHNASVTNVSSGVHNPINCLCHGYNPNQTAQYNVNVKHNLTKNIYCTNCHTKYNETTGDITIRTGVSGRNQSAHYIMNKTSPQLYNNSRGFFND